MPACLRTSHLRVDVGGVPAIDGLTLSTTGDHVLVLGAARALFEAAAGLRRAARGEIFVDDAAPRDAMRGSAACAPFDPPLPGSWTVAEYTSWSARLAGHTRASASAMAAEALERMDLASLARTRLAAAAPAVRRALGIAAALATGAPLLLLEDPLPGLPDDIAHTLARATARALDDRRTVLFAGHLRLESPLAIAADEAVVVDRSLVVAQGAPAEIAASARIFGLRVLGDVDAFVRAVTARGARAVVSSGAPPPPVFVRLELGPLSAGDVLRVAVDSNSVVLELRPLDHPFA